VRDAQAEGRMEQIANRLTEGMCHAGLTWRCRMLASRQIDAFSLPGGLIYVTRGYYDRLANDEHLAAILAHMIAHNGCKDHQKPRCRTENETLVREVSADCRAVHCLSRAGYRADALVEALKLLGPHRSGRWGAVRLQAALSAARAAARPGPIGPEFPHAGRALPATGPVCPAALKSVGCARQRSTIRGQTISGIDARSQLKQNLRPTNEPLTEQ